MGKRQLVGLIILISIATVIALNLNTLEPGAFESVNITFSGVGSNSTFYFKIPRLAIILFTEMNVTGEQSGYGEYPTDPTIDISNDGDIEWNYTGVFSTTETVFNFSSEIQDYLEDCDNDEEDCEIPINVTSQTAGKIKLDAINITYGVPPIVSLINPINNFRDIDGTVTFNCSMTDDLGLVNVTLYGNWSGGWHANETKSLSGTSDSTTFIKNLNDGIYKWNCLAYDNESFNDWGDLNYTLIIGNDSDNPIINLESPLNNTLNNNGAVFFKYNVTDSTSYIANCSLILDGNINQTDYTIIENASQFFVLSGLTNKDYTWEIECYDNSENNNYAISEQRKFEVIDNSPPIVSLLDPDNGKTDKIGNIVFEYIAEDYGYDIANCSLIVNGMINQTDSNITESKRQNFTINNLSYEEYDWSVNCTDTSPNNNQGKSYTYDLYVNKKPMVILNGPVYNSTDNDGDVIFNYTVQDDGMLRNCTLYHNINGTWLPNMSNTFVQPNVSLYFIIENAPDGYFEWNVVCYDDARLIGYDWGSNYNFGLNINKTLPQVSTIPDLFWAEDDILTLNLSNYFSDPKGDELTYSVEHSDNVSIMINNNTGIVVLESDKNWFGNISVVFTAFDEHGMSGKSNNVTFAIYEQGDTAPRFISISPENNSIDKDGYVFFECNVSDDYGLVSVGLYSNTSGNWSLEEIKSVSGLNNLSVFNLTNLSDGIYEWACVAYDNASQEKMSDVYVVEVDVGVEMYNTFPSEVVNNIDAKDAIVIYYSYYLNGSITLGNLSIKESDEESYYTKNMSEESSFFHNGTDPYLIVYFHKFTTNLTNIFDNNFSVGNSETLNISLDYWFGDNKFTIYDNATIEVVGSV